MRCEVTALARWHTRRRQAIGGELRCALESGHTGPHAMEPVRAVVPVVVTAEQEALGTRLAALDTDNANMLAHIGRRR